VNNVSFDYELFPDGPQPAFIHGSAGHLEVNLVPAELIVNNVSFDFELFPEGPQTAVVHGGTGQLDSNTQPPEISVDLAATPPEVTVGRSSSLAVTPSGKWYNSACTKAQVTTLDKFSDFKRDCYPAVDYQRCLIEAEHLEWRYVDFGLDQYALVDKKCLNGRDLVPRAKVGADGVTIKVVLSHPAKEKLTKKITFLLDSGAELNILSANILDKLGLRRVGICTTSSGFSGDKGPFGYNYLANVSVVVGGKKCSTLINVCGLAVGSKSDLLGMPGIVALGLRVDFKNNHVLSCEV